MKCLGCGAKSLEIVLSLGQMPLANALVPPERVGLPEPRYPLEVAFCVECALVQLTESIDPRELFTDYPYFSSYSDTMVEHARVLAHQLLQERSLGPQSFVMEIASNDGYLLQHYARAGVPVLGIDPAKNVAAVATQKGIPTLEEFFGEELAADLRNSGRSADVIHAHNVIAHVPDINGVLRGIKAVLKDGGVAVIETPYVAELVDRLEFDTIYHEHLYYYSLTSLMNLFHRNGLTISSVDRIPIHGGSLRVYATHIESGESDPSVTDLVREEDELGLSRLDYYKTFERDVRQLCGRIQGFLTDLKAGGASLAAYGAAAKGAVLLNACDIGNNVLDFVADRSDHKQGMYMPGVHLPIVPPEMLVSEMPDYVLLLAWNFSEEILNQQKEYRIRGGRFVHPIPSPRVLTND